MLPSRGHDLCNHSQDTKDIILSSSINVSSYACILPSNNVSERRDKTLQNKQYWPYCFLAKGVHLSDDPVYLLSITLLLHEPAAGAKSMVNKSSSVLSWDWIYMSWRDRHGL